jgi:hypothetical protein
MLEWNRYGYDKTRVESRYAELLILHPVGSSGHVVHFGMYGARIIDALFFMLGGDRYGFDKKRVRTRYAELVFLHSLGSEGHLLHSGASYA